MLDMAEETSEYYTVEQIATKLQMAPESVTRLIRQGKMPGYKVGGSWRINKAEFARYMKTQRNTYQEPTN